MKKSRYFHISLFLCGLLVLVSCQKSPQPQQEQQGQASQQQSTTG